MKALLLRIWNAPHFFFLLVMAIFDLAYAFKFQDIIVAACGGYMLALVVSELTIARYRRRHKRQLDEMDAFFEAVKAQWERDRAEQAKAEEKPGE